MKKLGEFIFVIVSVILALSLAACTIQATNGPGQAERTPINDSSSGETSGTISNGAPSGTADEKSDGTGVQEEASSEIYPAKKSSSGESKWGYIDRLGRFVIQPAFSQAYRFQKNGLAVVMVDNKAGIIDRSGKFIVSPAYNYIGQYNDGLAIAYDGEESVVLDEKGNVISEKYAFIGSYSSNRAAYTIDFGNGQWVSGYLDEKGKPVIKAGYEQAMDFEGDRAVVKMASGNYELIDPSGNVVKTFDHRYVGEISEGMMMYQPIDSEKYGYMDINGNIVISPSFIYAENFKGGNAVVDLSEDYSVRKLGLIDKKGRFVIEAQYNELLQLGEGMTAAGAPIDPQNIFGSFKYALVGTDGKLRTDFTFYRIDSFHEGIASAQDATGTFFIDASGNMLKNLPSAQGAGSLENLDGLIYADIDQRPYYMDQQGTVVYKPSTETTLDNGIVVSEGKYKPNRDYIVYYPILSNLEDLQIQEKVNEKLRDVWTRSTTTSIKQTDTLNNNYIGSFSISLHHRNLLVLNESGYDYPIGAAHGMPLQQYVHVDTKTGTFYELKDLFKAGSDYSSVLSAIVQKQIEAQSEEIGVMAGSYEGIRSDHPFYLTEDALNLYFYPYEIAPYAAGFPTFKVSFGEIEELIDKTGDFWLSFN